MYSHCFKGFISLWTLWFKSWGAKPASRWHHSITRFMFDPQWRNICGSGFWQLWSYPKLWSDRHVCYVKPLVHLSPNVSQRKQVVWTQTQMQVLLFEDLTRSLMRTNTDLCYISGYDWALIALDTFDSAWVVLMHSPHEMFSSTWKQRFKHFTYWWFTTQEFSHSRMCLAFGSACMLA